VDVPQGDIDDRQAIVQLLRFLAIGQRFIDPFGIFVELIFQAVGFAELGKSQGKARIGLHRTVERRDGQVEFPPCRSAGYSRALSVGFIGSGINRATAGTQHFGRDLDAHQLGQARHGFVFERGEVAARSSSVTEPIWRRSWC